ncbi:MAG: TonB-dependent receptor [Opitutaceae bacterium]|nr:TonB-dependent receptor [Opitutaceae bacterium]
MIHQPLLRRLLLATATLLASAARAQQAPANPSTAPAASGDGSETVVLTPFEITSTKDRGYQATETLAGTRIRTNLADVGAALSVITKEFLKDIGATDSATLLQYTTNAEVAGTRGTYAGLGNGTSVDETGNLRAPGGAQRVRGLAAADNSRDFFVTDIPWDSYIVDRIDIQRGPNSILFGLGSPAGMVNATTRNAEFRTLGSTDLRFGSYGTARATLDFNQVIIPKVLAIRVDGLWSDEKFRQEPAFENNRRYYGTVRFDPQLIKRPGFQTSIKAKYENGDIKANRPRTVTPNDNISPWFRPVNNGSQFGGLGKLAINSGYELGANAAGTNPWLTAGLANQQQPIWFIDGATNQLYRIYGGYINSGALNNDGSNRGASGSLIGQRYADQFFGVSSLPAFATNARLPNFQFGQYKNTSMLDSSIFNFYEELIDGPTSSQFEHWNAYNFNVSQTGWGDRIGIELSADRQKYQRGGQALLGFGPSINIDILRNFQDLNANPNFGRPYIGAGPGSGNSYSSDREYFRGSLFGELRATDLVNRQSFLAKLLGKHRFNGVYSDETYSTENRSWQMYANSQAWAGYWNQTNGASSPFTDRPPVAAIYLGPSLASANAPSGISRIGSPVTLTSGGVYTFDARWRNPAGVTPSQPWTVPANLTPTIFDAANPPAGGFTQASNPANYVGWNSNFQNNLLAYNNGADPSLLTRAQKSERATKSWAGSWQGFLWNGAVIPTFGWRYDNVAGRAATALPVTLNRGMLNLSPDAYRLSNFYPSSQIFKAHSTNGGVVVHLNRILNRDRLPINVSLSYSKSDNFQVTDTRRDIYGSPIGNPTGKTKDYGVLLSTKDNKFSFRAVRYQTSVANASTQADLGGLAGTIQQGLRFRNVFLYKMSAYTWDGREQSNNTPGQRYFWTPSYVNAAGRPVADLNGVGGSTAGTTLQTQAQADAHRDASIRAWNAIQNFLTGKGFFGAWGYTPLNSAALTDRATYEATLGPNTTTENGRAIPVQNNAALVPTLSTVAAYTNITPQGLSVTADTESKGYELELTANPLPNWRIAFNASKTDAVRNNFGGPVLDELVAFMDQQMAGVAGDMRQFNGNYVATNEVRQNWNNWRGQYNLLKLQQGTSASELRKWRWNVVTNYSFREGRLKGAGIGGSYRWQDKVIIGYPLQATTGTVASYDLNQPYYGPSEDALDLWANYERKLTQRINWKIQLNVRNVGKKDSLIPISIEPDGRTWASVRIAPHQEWFVTNTFSF